MFWGVGHEMKERMTIHKHLLHHAILYKNSFIFRSYLFLEFCQRYESMISNESMHIKNSIQKLKDKKIWSSVLGILHLYTPLII